jgi:hypothetical protein
MAHALSIQNTHTHTHTHTHTFLFLYQLVIAEFSYTLLSLVSYSCISLHSASLLLAAKSASVLVTRTLVFRKGVSVYYVKFLFKSTSFYLQKIWECREIGPFVQIV